jgi:hypothetical protein
MGPAVKELSAVSQFLNGEKITEAEATFVLSALQSTGSSTTACHVIRVQCVDDSVLVPQALDI